jgi:protein SCO1/2
MFSKKWLTSLFAAVAMQFVIVTTAATQQTSAEQAMGKGGDFTLNSFAGPVTLKELRGKLVLLFFGYTACVDVCPMTLWSITKAFSTLNADELDRVTAIFISLDPERDTPAVLQKYTEYFHPNITGVTDNMEVLTQLISDYGVSYEKKVEPDSALGYVIYHTPDILVVDSGGQLLDMRIPVSASAGEITEQIRELLDDIQ